MNKFSSIRFNRYGQIMRQHHDHIHSLFDGNERYSRPFIHSQPE